PYRATPDACCCVHARSTSVQRLSQNSHPNGGDRHSHRSQSARDEIVARRGRWRRKMNTLRRGRRILDPVARTGYSNQTLGLVVPRGELVIGQRPVGSQAIASACLEIVGTEAQGNPTPMIGSTAQHTGTPPHEVCTLGERVRLVRDLPTTTYRGVVVAIGF